MEGNQQKMRESLEALVRVIDECDSSSPLWWHHGAKGVIPLQKARAALSAPPRNCDRLSAEQCKEIFKMEMGIYLPQEATDRDRDIARCTAYGVIDALFAPSDAPFAPSTERKGEGDGR